MSSKKKSRADNTPGTKEANKPQSKPETDTAPDNTMPLVVGIAASAGGLAAFKELLMQLPANQQAAYVLIQHLAPDHESMLSELLAKDIKIPIGEATDGVQLQAGHAYVIPPNQQLYLLHDKLQLLPRQKHNEPFNPADQFFESLARDRGAASIGVVLSGTGSDGTRGLCAIKEVGGLTFAQSNDSAEYDGMPNSANMAGCVDFVMAPRDIGREISRIGTHPHKITGFSANKSEEILAITNEELNKIFVLLRSRTNHDFSYYKTSTIKRRISRRLMVHRLERVSEYLMLLQKDAEEIDQLFRDILINVTEFFRDPETFDSLLEIAMPQILENRPEGAMIRIWVPGCSSGEEVYSIAIAMHEYLGDRVNLFPVQIFGSDIDSTAIDKARAGLYPETISAQVSPIRLQRYFQRVSGGYQATKLLRDMCIFAEQSVTRDPPFSRIDLISCRNLLIYLGKVLQEKVIRIFHYALQPQGFLLLGPSESIGSQADLFALKHKKTKLYQKKSVAKRVNDDLMFSKHELPTGLPHLSAATNEAGKKTGSDLSNSLILWIYCSFKPMV